MKYITYKVSAPATLCAHLPWAFGPGQKLSFIVHPALCRRTYSSDLSYYIYYSININYL